MGKSGALLCTCMKERNVAHHSIFSQCVKIHSISEVLCSRACKQFNLLPLQWPRASLNLSDVRLWVSGGEGADNPSKKSCGYLSLPIYLQHLALAVKGTGQGCYPASKRQLQGEM